MKQQKTKKQTVVPYLVLPVLYYVLRSTKTKTTRL